MAAALLAAPRSACSQGQDKDYSLQNLAPPPAEHIDYSADTFEYEAGTAAAHSLARLQGHVWLKESTWTIRAGQLTVDLDRRYAHAVGGLSLDDGVSQLNGREGDFDLETHEGRVRDALAEYAPWRIWAREGFLDAQHQARFRKAYFTSCGAEPPHYHFTSSSMRVAPRKWLYATNVLFYIGQVPLFYTPFLWKSLSPEHLLHTRFSPGYDHRNGMLARTTTLYRVSPALYGKLYLDYYGTQGPGFGSELQFHSSQDARGALFGYRVRELKTGRERWGVFGDHYQALGSSFAVQGRLQAQSDADFNNNYARSNAFRVTSELDNSAALVRRTNWYTTRLSYSRRDVQDPNAASLPADDPLHNRFVRDADSSPRMDFQTAPLSWRRLPLLYTVNMFADNHFDRSAGFTDRTAGTGLEATKSLNLARGLSLTPRASFNETYDSQREALNSFGSSDTLRDAFTGVYRLGANLRSDTRVGSIDIGPAFARRMKSGTFKSDSGAPDYGVEQEELAFQDTLRPSRKALFRLKTGYDFRQFRDQTIGFRQRVEPFIADLTFTPRWNLQVSLRDEYQLDQGNQAFLLQADVGDRLADYAGFGITHTVDHPGDYVAGGEFGWSPGSSSWRLGGALRTLVYSTVGLHLDSARLFEKEVWMLKDFHDFHTRTIFRIRPGGVKEFSFHIELRVGKEKERKIVRKDWESEWFPWRRQDEIDGH